jgi:hypothetical protein
LTTGAAATADEVAAAKETYFPTLTDNGPTIAAKAKMRARVMQDAVQRAGPAIPGGGSGGWSIRPKG